MAPEDRIQRMADEGLLDEKQAEMLRASFAGQHGVEPVPHSGVARVRGLFLGSAALVVVAVILMLAGGGRNWRSYRMSVKRLTSQEDMAQ